MGLVAGVDGCHLGWVAVGFSLETGALSPSASEKLEDLLAGLRTASVIAIDIPIGLPESGPRRCDQEARAMLGWPRRNSVFPAPIRAALLARTREESSEITRRRDGRRVTAQAWGIYPKIREVDALLHRGAELRTRLREVHPEVCLCQMNGGQPMRMRKKSEGGRRERLDVLARHFSREEIQALFEQARGALGLRRRDCQDDDIVDAAAGAWTARRIAEGHGRAMPQEVQADSRGLRMEIFY